MKKILVTTALASSLLLAGCASSIPGSNTYTANETGVAQTVRFGVVESVRPVVLNKGNTGVGLGAGAILGGIAGSTIGGGWGSAAAAVGGAVIGGIAGQAVESRTSQSSGLEITVKLSSGQLIAVTQPADEHFSPGERVRVVSSGERVRVTH